MEICFTYQAVGVDVAKAQRVAVYVCEFITAEDSLIGQMKV